MEVYIAIALASTLGSAIFVGIWLGITGAIAWTVFKIFTKKR